MLVFILVCVLAAVYLWKRNAVRSVGLPYYPGGLPLIGHAHLFFGDSKKLWRFLKEISEYSCKINSPVLFNLGLNQLCMMTDPDECFSIANNFLKKDYIYHFAKPWLGEGLVTATVTNWKRDRKLLNPSFNQQILDEFMIVFNNQSRRLVKVLQDKAGKGNFDHGHYLYRNSLETIYITAMGMELRDDNELDMEYVECAENTFHTIVERFQKFWLHYEFLWERSSLKRTQDKYIKSMHAFSDSIIKKRKLERSRDISTSTSYSGKKIKTFLDLLLDIREEGVDISDQAIREHIDTIIVAGHDTNATILMYSMILIGSHPQVQERLFKEIQEVFGDDDRDVEKQDLPKLVYTEAVLKETLRLYPIAPIIGRYVDKEIQLNKGTITPGTTCVMMTIGTQRHPVWGDDAEVFNPERWMEPASIPTNSNAYYPFGAGRRTCIGKTYAMMGMKTLLVHFLRHYRISADHTKMVLKMICLLKPDSGHHISIERRR